MGMYINSTTAGPTGASFEAKLNAIIVDGGLLLGKTPPEEFTANLVCVVDNGIFAAAAFIASPKDLKDFTLSSDPRRKNWLIWDKVSQFAQ